MSEANTLCVRCRSTFTDAALADQSRCPACGNKGLPADLRLKATVTLTHSEWRILTIWAHRWAEEHCKPADKEGYDSVGTVEAILREMKRQAPTMPSLTLFGDMQEAATALGLKAELHGPDGIVQVVEPEKKH